MFVVLLLVVFSAVAVAEQEQMPLYKGFPVYPPSVAQEYEGSGSVHFKVPFTSYGYLDDARVYIEKAASVNGWHLDLVEYGEPEIWTYSMAGDPTKVVWVYFNQETEPFELKPATTYFSAPRGSLEYTFIDKNTLLTFHFKQILTLTRNKARDAYVELLKGTDFDAVAATYSVNKEVDRSLVRYPICRLLIEQEVTRLMPGQISDVYRDKDNYYYIVKLLRVTRGDEEISYLGQNPEEKRPESAAILDRWSLGRNFELQ